MIEVMAKVRDVVDGRGEVVRRRPVVGDMRWDGKVWRRWNGQRWARAAYSLDAERLGSSAPLHDEPSVDDERRQRALELAVEDQVTTNGASVVLDGPGGVVLGYRPRVSHLFHALMTLLTAGLWALVWVAVALARREDRLLLEVDRWGNVWAQPVVSA